MNIIACCPQIQDINLIYMGTNGSPSCAPGLKSTDTTILSSSLLSAYFCYPKFTAILNNNNLNGYTYGWYFTYWSSDGGSLGTICEVPNTITAYAPALSVPGGRTVLVGVNFFIEGQGCQRTELHKTLVVEYPCQSAYTFGLKPDDKQLEKYFLKKAKHYNILLVYPNPTNDQIRIDIPDNDIYSFEIYNTLGQPVLNQQVSLDASSVSLLNLKMGVYIGVLKSKNNVIHSEKIYKQ